MSTIPDFMPVLACGKHKSPTDGACLMEYVSFLAGERWTDLPLTTHPVLARAAQGVNDALLDRDRHLLLPLISGLMGTSAGSDDKVLHVRLAVWAARQVAHLNADPRVEAAIVAAEAWCDTPDRAHATAAWKAARAARAAGGGAAATSVAAGRAAYAASWAADAAAVYHADATYAYAAVSAVTDPPARVQFLAGLIDEYDRLTGRTTRPEVTADDLARCAALTTRPAG